MSQTTGRPLQSHLITSVGVANLVFGGLFVAFGVYCLVEGADAVATLFEIKQEAAKAGASTGVSVPAEDAKQLNDLADLGAKGLSGVILAMVGVVAGCSMVQGAPLVLVGLGVLFRKGWARVLALVFAVLAGLEGLACLGEAAQGRAFLVSGIVLTAYAILSFVGLLGRRASAEFSGRGAPPYEAQRESERRFGGAALATAEPPPIPAAGSRSLAVPVLGVLLAAATITAAVFAYLHFNPAGPHSGPAAAGKPDAGPGKLAADAPRAKPAEWLPDLMAAAEAGQLSRIMEAAAKGAAVDEKNEQGETALMKAAAKGHVQASALLLALGAQVNEQDAKGQTPLMLAAANGHGALVDLFLGNEAGGVNLEAVRQQALLAAPADLDKIARDPSKALNIRLPALEAFKPPHAEVDARDAEGQTALMKAILNGHHEVAAVLIQHGASGALTDNEGNNIRHLAAAKGNVDALKHFEFRGDGYAHYKSYLDKSDILFVVDLAAANNQGMQAWMLAAAGGHVEALKRVIDPNATKEVINQKNKDGKTALELAAANSHKDVVDFLKPLAGVDVVVAVPPPPPPEPPAPAPKEPTPLMKAVDAGDLDAAQALLTAAGLSADDRDEEDKTVLMHAAAKGDSKTVLLLSAYAGKSLEAGYLERKDKEGRTALIHAAAAGHTAAVEALTFAVTAEWDRGRLNWFAPLSYKDKSGKTALEQAEAKGDKATADLLRAYAKDNLNARSTVSGKTALEEASERGDLPAVEGLLKLGAGKEPATGQNLSALTSAAANNHPRVVQALLDSFGADKEARKKYVALVANPTGDKPVTALLVAAENGHIVVVQELLDAFGDDKDARKNYMQMTTVSFNPTTQANDMAPALAVANRGNHKEIAAMLKKYGATE